MLSSFLFGYKGINNALSRKFWRRALHMENLKLPVIGALDQGTSSTRFILFDCKGQIVGNAQKSINLYHPNNANWVEQDPIELVSTSIACIDEACHQVEKQYGVHPRDIVKAIGITNQRETSVVWDRGSGRPLHPALVWMDQRTSSLLESISEEDSINQQKITGLPVSTYFSAGKYSWLKKFVSNLQSNDYLFGTVDSWLIYNLVEGRPHLTDITNAHRTALLNLSTCQWDPTQLKLYDTSSKSLPSIRPSSFNFGNLSVSELKGAPITAVVGDQHASLYGHGCLTEGSVKCTFGTGCFLLCNMGNKTNDFISRNTSFLKTIAYAEDKSNLMYALEAPIANCGSAIDWAIGKLHLLTKVDHIDHIKYDNAAGVIFVPHLSGSLAPRWNPNDKGSFHNLSLDSDNEILILAILESIAFSIKQVIQILNKELEYSIKELKIDGGLVRSDRFCQLLANVLGISVIRPSIVEMTALGVAMLAARGVGTMIDGIAIRKNVFMPKDSSPHYQTQYEEWLTTCDQSCKSKK